MVKDYLNRLIREQPWLGFPFFAAITLLIYRLLPAESTFVERFYSHGLFAVFRLIWDHTLGLIPLPLIYLLILTIIIFLVKGVKKAIGGRAKWWSFLKRTTIVISLLISIFYWTWGFNYKRVDVRKTLQLEVGEMSIDELYSEYMRVSDTLNSLRMLIGDDMESYIMAADEGVLRGELEQLYSDIGLSYSGEVRVRKIRPKGSLLHISTAGVYLPFVGEGHIDAGLHPITHPFTVMHEMSHAYGWTGEDVCNFLALLGNVRSANPLIRYSGYLGYWRYLRSNAYRADKERFDATVIILSDDVKKDYNEIIEYQNRYTDIMPKLRDLIYDSYLKSHGIAEGLTNYSAIIKLSRAWQQRYGSLTANPQ